jgi:hypothetical protein
MYVELMRTVFAHGLSASCLLALACGAGQAGSDGANAAKSPGTSAAVASTMPSEPDRAPAADARPVTTTLALGDGGNSQGAKLPETRSGESAPSATSPPPPQGPHTHDPGRGPQDIRAIVVAHRDEARACYDKALKYHPGIEGDLVIQWTIDPKGSVTQVSLDTSRSQITEPTVIACVAEIIKQIHFAQSAGGFETKAFYPFNFHPRHGQPPIGQ